MNSEKRKIENVEQLANEYPQLNVDQKLKRMYELGQEIGELHHEEAVASMESEYGNSITLFERLQQRKARLCEIENDVRRMAQQFEERSNEFVSGDLVC